MKFTDLYNGMRGMIQNSIGRKESLIQDSQEYKNTIRHFRYPGEILERMEQYGYSSVEDYISVMAALSSMRKYLKEEMFTGNQLGDFLARAKTVAVKENNLFLLYQLGVYSHSLDIPCLVNAASHNSSENLLEFLNLALKSNEFWKYDADFKLSIPLAGKLLAVKKDEIPKFFKMDILDNSCLFCELVYFAYNIVYTYTSDKVKEIPEWGCFLLALLELYYHAREPKTRKKLLKMGFSEMDILNLACGIWVKEKDTTALAVSTIRWWRLKKEWFHALFHQDKKITICDTLEDMLQEAMPRKIDGENISKEFYVKSMKGDIPNRDNSFLLFKLLTLKIKNEYGKYNEMNHVEAWNTICPNHPLMLDSEKQRSWVRDLISYLYPNKLPDKNIINAHPISVINKILVELISPYIKDEKQLDNISSFIEEIFHIRVKEFILRHTREFYKEDISALLEKEYLSLNEFIVLDKNRAAIFISCFDKKLYLDFLQDYCESRNWIFTESEADFLNNVLRSSWPVSLAFYNKTVTPHFEAYTDDEIYLLLGLVCEICTRIPDICDLSNLMAGFLSCIDTRKVIGEEICNEWYRELLDRDYTGIKSLQKNFLSQDEYQAIQRKEEEKKKKAAEEEKLRKITDMKRAISGDISSLDEKSALSYIFSKIPSSVYFNRLTSIAIISILDERYSNSVQQAGLKNCVKIYHFFIDCYKEKIISRDKMLHLIEQFTEVPEND